MRTHLKLLELSLHFSVLGFDFLYRVLCSAEQAGTAFIRELSPAFLTRGLIPFLFLNSSARFISIFHSE